MDPRGLQLHRVEELRYAREVGIRIVGDDARQRGELLVFRGEDHGCGLRADQLRLEFFGSKKSDLAWRGPFQRTDLADLDLRVAGDAAAEARGDLPERERPRHAAIWRAAYLPAP